MSGGFVIPGLGEAKPNDKLPVSSFDPEALAAAAGKQGEQSAEHKNDAHDQVGDRMDTDAGEQKQTATETETAPLTRQDGIAAVEPSTGDAMDVDSKPAESVQPVPSSLNTNGELPNAIKTDPPTTSATENQAEAEHITDALDAALFAMSQPSGGSQPQSAPAADQPQAQSTQPPNDAADGPEWEADSSPYESSSDSSSSDDSSDDSDGEAMTLEDTVRMIMAGIDGSDDEGEAGDGKGGKGAQVRTKNEQPDWVPPKPTVTITPEMDILPLGSISTIVDNSVLITAGENGEERVLDIETAVCRADRTIIASIADVIGSVLRPMYVLRFSTAEDLEKEGLEKGMAVYYSPKHAQVVLTRALRKQKGYDASNLHDEEIPMEEQEFSDDEAEQAHKREAKMKKRGNRGGRGGAGGQHRDAPPGRAGPGPSAAGGSADVGLNYDDEDDGPYRPLTRPANFGMGAPPSGEERFAFGAAQTTQGSYGNFRGGRGRGRGNRGGFRGGRGGGGGGGGNGDGYSQPQQPRFQNQNQNQNQNQHQTQNQQQPQQTTQQPAAAPFQWGFPPPPMPFAFPPFQQAAGAFGATGQFPPPPPPAPAGGQAPVQPNWQGMSALYSNPAFVAAFRQAQQIQAQQQQQQQQQGQGQGHPGWGQNPGGGGSR